MHLLRCLWFFVAYYDITIIAKHIPAVANSSADHLSRCHMSLFFCSNPQADPAPAQLPTALLSIISTPDMDWTSAAFGRQFTSIISTAWYHPPARSTTQDNSVNSAPVPTTEATLLLFLAFLAKDGLAYTTIKVYLAAISNLHSDTTAGLHNIYSQQLTPYLEQVVQGIKKEQLRSRPPRIRLPVTTEIMSRIHNILARSPNDHQSIMMWAACCTAFLDF